MGSEAQSRREGRNLPACKDLCLSPWLGSREVRGGGPRCLGTRWSRGDVLRVALPRAAASHGGFAPHLSLVPTAAPRATGPVGKAAVPRKP